MDRHLSTNKHSGVMETFIPKYTWTFAIDYNWL